MKLKIFKKASRGTQPGLASISLGKGDLYFNTAMRARLKISDGFGCYFNEDEDHPGTLYLNFSPSAQANSYLMQLGSPLKADGPLKVTNPLKGILKMGTYDLVGPLDENGAQLTEDSKSTKYYRMVLIAEKEVKEVSNEA